MNKTEVRFWSHVRLGDDCWEWSLSTVRGGYGKFADTHNKTTIAHRYAYKSWYNIDISNTMVLHKCDNPLCCRPSHLYLGDHQQNIRDRTERNDYNKGTNHPMAKLSDNDIQSIRDLAGSMTQDSIAIKFGIVQSYVSDIINKHERLTR